MLQPMHALNHPAKPPTGAGWTLLALGFRPFFLMASIAAVGLMLAWLAAWHGVLVLPAYYDPVAWHAHEMLFGYTVGVIAGFLLTAVRNWTGIATWQGPKLGLLALIWLAGRLLPWLPGTSPMIAALVDLMFLPLLAISLFGPLWKGRSRVNRVFVPLLFSMALANLLSHLQLHGLLDGAGDARRIMLDLILLLIVLVGGRVLPFFTRSVIPGFQPLTRRWVEYATFAILLLLTAMDAVTSSPAAVVTALWLTFAVIQAVRLAGWSTRRVWRMPVLWVLHTGYAWLVIGALLQGLAGAGWFPATAALHALGVGVVGIFTLGMMARVTRGHTGRPIVVGKAMAVGFVMLNVAAVIRVFGPAWLPAAHSLWVDLSAGLWLAVFGLFALRYAPRLLQPRIDGKRG